ncbi:MAG TPA: patatin-like phospholipase family protein [Burkholderiaceae bacterium]|jgi:NTE family protein
MRNKKMVTLALQGGGSHGAFTWGVLDRLLEDERVDVEAISGASAGAVNAVVLAYGHAKGGREGARRALSEFWERVSIKAPFSFLPAESMPSDRFGLAGSTMAMYLSLTRLLSPYQLNPFDINPLRDILAEQIDFDYLNLHGRIQLFVAATQVGSGKMKIFRDRQMSLDAVLASACLPSLHRAVEIDGQAYWDGGFTANPPIFPLLHQCRARDIVVVLLHAHPKAATPSTADEIFSRLTEIGFSAALFTELQGIALAKREAQRGWFAIGRMERRLRNLHVHLIDSPDFMSRLDGLSKLNTQAPFISALREEGRRQADRWLDDHFHHLGVLSSFDLAQYLRR